MMSRKNIFASIGMGIGAVLFLVADPSSAFYFLVVILVILMVWGVLG